MVINVEELSGLVEALVPFTRQMLREHGAFLPLGAIVKSGEVVITPAGLESPHASVEERLDTVKAALRHHASGAACAAVAYCVDVKLSDLRNGETTDAVHLAFEHRSGEALDVVFPYLKTDDDVEFARPMVRIAACCIFEARPAPAVN